MNQNMGSADRLVRALLVAPALVVAAVLIGASSVVGIILFVVAGVMLLTSAVGSCPLYVPLGLTTCRRHGPTA